MAPATAFTLEQAQDILAPFSCLQNRAIQSPDEKMAVQQAVLYLASITDNQILGILADSWEQAIQALKHYSNALGLPIPHNINEGDKPVYVKFNPGSGLCYASPYIGEHRGVLVSFQSDVADGFNAMCGHLPLTLFDP